MPRSLSKLGRRERQIMDILVRRRRATVADVLADLDDPPTYSAVRGMLRLLKDKGYVRHEWDGPRYVYTATADPIQMQRTAVTHLVDTFFHGSAASAVVAMLGAGNPQLTPAELDRLGALIDAARQARSGGTA
jgi:BlaI family penicillinase repressor